MPSILFKCPSRGIHTHAWIADDAGVAAGPDAYIAIDCTACGRIHYLDPASGALLGGEKVSVSDDVGAVVQSAPPPPRAEPFQTPYRNIAIAVIAIALLGWIVVAAFR